MASMVSMKLGSKSEVFQRQGQTWNCNNGLPTDIVVEIGEVSFRVHKFPLLSRSRVLEKKIGELSGDDDGSTTCTLELQDLPGGAKSFELIAKFCYGVKLELNAHNVVGVRCAAEQLQMTEEYGEGNLILHADNFLQELLGSWKDSLRVLQTCEEVLAHAEQLHIVTRCITSLAVKATTDPTLFGWPAVGSSESTSRSSASAAAASGDMWNGISTTSSSKPRSSGMGWWYEDVSMLSLSLYKRFIAAVQSRGMKPEFIAGSLIFYAKRHLPGLNKRGSNAAATSASTFSESDQRNLLEEIVAMLPGKKGVTSTKLLLDLLQTAMTLHAGPPCRESLEKRVGAQLDDAALEDLLITNLGYSNDTLYDVECVQRILDHFMLVEQSAAVGESPGIVAAEEDEDQLMGTSPALTSMAMVARLVDGYLAEVAPDANLRFPMFQSLAAAIPDARSIDDGLYRAIDIYLKAHPWLTDSEREQLCRLMNCQKLSLEACTHAAQNERLPLRMVVQVLFFEQLRLRTSIASWFFVSNNLDDPHAPPGSSLALVKHGGGGAGGRSNTNANKELSVTDMRVRVSELEKECSSMKVEIEKMCGMKTTSSKGSSSSWSILPKRLRLKAQPFCSGEEAPVDCHKGNSSGELKMKAHQLEYLEH